MGPARPQAARRGGGHRRAKPQDACARRPGRADPGRLALPAVLALALLAPAAPAPAAPPFDALPYEARRTAAEETGGDSYAFPVGPARGPTPPPMQVIEGEISRAAWTVPGSNRTVLQLLAPLREALEGMGYEIVLDCAEQACGGFDFRFAVEVIPAPAMNVDLFDYHALTARRLPDPSGQGAGDGSARTGGAETGGAGAGNAARGAGNARIPTAPATAGTPAPDAAMPDASGALAKRAAEAAGGLPGTAAGGAETPGQARGRQTPSARDGSPDAARAEMVLVLVSRSADAGHVQVVHAQPGPVGAPDAAGTDVTGTGAAGRGAAGAGMAGAASDDPLFGTDAARPGADMADPALSDPGLSAPALPGPGEDAFLARLRRDGRVVLRDLRFDTGAGALDEGPSASLTALARLLHEDPECHLLLVGHTDSEGGLDTNRALSRRRSEAVRQRLITVHGVPASQVEARGAGYLAPIANNATEAGRKANRRVEAILLPKM